MSFVVAIDGPAGSGKGTITQFVSKACHLVNVDTGAMYRCVTLKALNLNIKPDEVEKIEEMLKDIQIEIKREGDTQIIFLDNQDVSKEIRTPKVDSFVAKYAALGCVREKMTPIQRKMGAHTDIIMEGRDIGTVVFPDADVKIYLDASVEERAKRRFEQNQKKGMKDSYEEVLKAIKERHLLETTREISPLRQAKDAIYIDSSHLTIDEVVEKIVKIIEDKRK